MRKKVNSSRLFITSFSEEGYKQYGKTFIEHFIQYWPKKERLVVFYENTKPDLDDGRITYYNLMEDMDLQPFLMRLFNNPQYNLIDKNNYRFQAGRFCRKIFALTSPLLDIEKTDYRVWIDTDVITKKDIPDDFFDRVISNPDALAHYIGRETSWDHSECGFVAYKMDLAKQFLVDFRNIYSADIVFSMKEWHDSFIFDELRREYQTRGVVFENLAKDHDIFHPWPEIILGQYLEHLKGPVAKKQIATKVNLQEMMKDCKNRYEQILRFFPIYKPETILEVGTFDGNRALELVEEALKFKSAVHYIGFDLFEEGSKENDEKEMNAKGQATINSVFQKFEAFKQDHPGFTYELIKGNTRETLPAYNFTKPIHLAFIDGGHSVETIASDYKAIEPHANMIIFDDLYIEGVDIEKYGCNKVVAKIPHIILPVGQQFGTMKVALCMVGPVIDAFKDENTHNLNLKTRNCAADSYIQANVKYCSKFTEEGKKRELELLTNLTPVKFVNQAFAPHDETVVIVSAGEALRHPTHPDYEDSWNRLRKYYAQGIKLLVCKTNHDEIISKGIIPFGCLLLDPRDHVITKFTPDKRVVYFVASMCHATTWDTLIKAGCKVVGYHAAVNAGEIDVIRENFGPESHMIAGGSTSIMRGIPLFYMMGFRRFETIALDSCYFIKPEKPHGRTDKSFMEVSVNGRDFTTDAEMVAQSMDGEITLKLFPDCQFVFHGDGLFQHSAAQAKKRIDQHAGEQGIVDMRFGPWLAAFKNKSAVMEYVHIQNAINALEARKLQIQDQKDNLNPYSNLFE